MVRIPSEYQEVEYIESTGTQWIDTGVVPTTETVSQLKFLVPEYNGDVIYGFFDAEATDYRFFIYNGIFMFDLGGFRIRSISDERRNKIYEIELGNYHIKDLVTNIFYASAAKKGVSATCTITLNNYKNTRFSKCRWYYVKIYEDTVLVRNFIPCYRKSSGEIGMYDTVSKQFYTNSGTGTFLKGNDVTYDNINLLESRRRILLNTPHIETVSDTVASFKTDVATKLKGCKIHFTPIQEGEGDPSPDNVRPIHGWDGVNVYISKRNLLVADDITFTSGKYINGSGAVGNSPYYKISNVIPCLHLAGKTITFNTIIGSTSVTVTSVGFYKNETINTDNCVLCAYRQSNSKAYTTVTVPSTANYMVICLNTSITLDDRYIVEGSTPPQEIDTPNSITIPFPKTIYGGYVDLVSGELVETWVCREISTFSSISKSSSTAEPWVHRFSLKHWSSSGYDKANGIENMISDVVDADGLGKTNYTMQGVSNTVDIYVYDNTISTIAEFKEKYANHYIAYPLRSAAYTTHQLSPTTLSTPLRGINNIWSNANGNIEVSFYTH